MPHRFPTTRRVVTTCTIALLAAGLTACGTTESPTSTPTTPAAQATGRAALVLDDGWIKAVDEAMGGMEPMTGMFGTLRNSTDHEVTITGGSSPAAGMVELHETVKTDSGRHADAAQGRRHRHPGRRQPPARSPVPTTSCS